MTALQELIEELKQFKNFPLVDQATIDASIAFAELRLEKEKQQIEDAFTISRTSDGCGWNNEDAIESAIGYYESTFSRKVV